MAVPAASLAERNLRLSVQRRLREAWAEPGSILVGWNEASFDPDALSGESDPAASWAAVSWLSSRSSAGGASLLQVDLCSRCAADPIADLPLRMADALSAALRGTVAIPMYDFSAVSEEADEETLIAGNAVLLQTEAGRLGARSDMLGPVREREVWRVTVTYRFRLLSDASPTAIY